MNSPAPQHTYGDRISPRNFKRLAGYIFNYSGIKITESKLTMLEGRLRRRLRATGIDGFDAYCTFLFDNDGLATESVHLIDVVTTNKTDFFREPNHFDYMRDVALPELHARGVRRIRSWSSACSIGAEPYTMAMVLEDYRVNDRGPDYSILATDLSTDVLQKAQRGIYPAEMIDPVPADMQQRYVMQSRDREARLVRISPRLRSKVGFMRLNLMDRGYKVGDPMHIIFCRNVLIYFDKKTQLHVMQNLCDCLAPGGYLFIGHSESIATMNLPVRQIANTIFIKE